jgi:hypothetical protein
MSSRDIAHASVALAHQGDAINRRAGLDARSRDRNTETRVPSFFMSTIVQVIPSGAEMLTKSISGRTVEPKQLPLREDRGYRPTPDTTKLNGPDATSINRSG